MYQGLNSDPHSRWQTLLPSEAPCQPIIRNINMIVKEWQWMTRNLWAKQTPLECSYLEVTRRAEEPGLGVLQRQEWPTLALLFLLLQWTHMLPFGSVAHLLLSSTHRISSQPCVCSDEREARDTVWDSFLWGRARPPTDGGTFTPLPSPLPYYFSISMVLHVFWFCFCGMRSCVS